MMMIRPTQKYFFYDVNCKDDSNEHNFYVVLQEATTTIIFLMSYCDEQGQPHFYVILLGATTMVDHNKGAQDCATQQPTFLINVD